MCPIEGCKCAASRTWALWGNAQLVWSSSLLHVFGLVFLSFLLGVGFFLTCENLGRMFDNSFHTCVFVVVVVVVLVEIKSCTFFPFIWPGSVHSGSASWDDCGKMFPDELCVSSFPDRLQHCASTVALSAHSNFFGSGVYAYLGVTCHLHFWQNDWGLLHAIAVTQEWNGHQIRVSTQS